MTIMLFFDAVHAAENVGMVFDVLVMFVHTPSMGFGALVF
jgi:hypothetical protein